MKKNNKNNTTRPNILFIMADEYRFPRYFGTGDGMLEPIKHILGFQGTPADIKEYAEFFPGLVRLRENAVVLRNHTIASSACVPSRAAIFTGQYGSRTGVTQTDGVFKSGDANNFPWLQPNGIPTLGDWFRADGYETHYFGKCHFADPPDHSLEEFGFDDWERSYPEPHGSSVNNMGIYRDFGFTDLVTTFLRGKGLALDYDRKSAELEANDPQETSEHDVKQRPWFAVASFTNPHDITTYPILPWQVDSNAQKTKPAPVPEKGDLSNPPEDGTWRVPLNPDGFPQENATLPPTWQEILPESNKPDCQYDYSMKLGIALASKSGKYAAALEAPKIMGLPLPLSDDPEKWATYYLQYYTYLHYVLDRHIDHILQTLEETGLLEKTIVVFAPDHGDFGAAHGLMQQKWHSAYQEAIHVPVVISSPQIRKNKHPMQQIDEVTSHIDLVPTLLGLAGIDSRNRAELASQLRLNHDVPELVGADLSKLITSKKGQSPIVEPDGTIRKGVLFVTDDMITDTLPYIDDPHSTPNEEHFEIYCKVVNAYINTKNRKWKPKTSILKEGPVCQPCHVQCVRHKNWKLSRYFNPEDETQVDQWEMYDLDADPNETENLLVYNASDFPTPFGSPSKPISDKIKKQAKELRSLLEELVERNLGAGKYPE